MVRGPGILSMRTDPVEPIAPPPADSLQEAAIRANIVQGAQAIVDAFRLAGEDDATNLLGGVLDGLASLVQQDAAGVYVTDRTGRRCRHTVTRGYELPVADLEAACNGQGVVGHVLSTGASVVLKLTDSHARRGRPSAKCRVVVPIVGSRSRVLGALDVWSDCRDKYDEDTVALIAVYGLAVGGAIEGSRLLAEVVVKRQLDKDLALARQVMEELLPHSTPTIAGLDVAGAHESSLAVGGDYYEFIPLGDGRWGVVVADVVGKGIAAAILVSALRASLSSLASHELSVQAIMRRVNRYFHESAEGNRYVTLFYAIMDPPRRRMLYVNAGHVPPVLLRASGDVELLDEAGLPLGLFESSGYFEGHVTFKDGDTLLLYTDGIVETADGQDDFYGVGRLVTRLKELVSQSATEICSGSMQHVRQHGQGQRTDDRTLVVIKSVSFS